MVVKLCMACYVVTHSEVMCDGSWMLDFAELQLGYVVVLSADTTIALYASSLLKEVIVYKLYF